MRLRIRIRARAVAVVLALASRIATAQSDDLDRSVALMARIGSASSPSFSPDGKRIAFVSNLSGLPQVWVVESSGGYPQLVTPFDDPVGAVRWSPDGAWLAFTVAPGGGMNEQVYVIRPDGTGLKRLSDGGKETNRLGVWSKDGRLLTLGSNRRTAAAIDSYVWDAGTAAARMVTENRGVGAFTDLSRDRKYAILDRLVNRGDNNLFLVDLSNGHETLLTPHDGPGSYSGEFAPDGRSIYLEADKDRDKRAFARLPLASDGRPGALTLLSARDDAELSGFAIDERGEHAALLWNAAGRSELELWDLKGSRSISKVKLPAELAGGLEFSKDGASLALVCSGAATPADVWIMDVPAGTLRQLTRSPHAGIDLSKLARPELVRFTAHDGLPLSGWLYRPKAGAGPFPVVLSFHGGPEGQERPSFNSQYQALVARGIGVFAPNVRGSSGFGKKFVNLDNGALRFDGVRDIEACVAAAVRAGADPRRVGIMGGSYGGYMVMAGLTEYPNLFAAGADLFGVVNFETFFKHTEPWMAAISKIEYGDPDREADLLRRLSPIHKIDRVTAPTIVLHGANDTNVPVVEAEQVVDNLRKRNVPVEYVLFPDEGHGWRKTPNRIRSAIAVTRWFEKYLKPG